MKVLRRRIQPEDGPGVRAFSIIVKLMNLLMTFEALLDVDIHTYEMSKLSLIAGLRSCL